MRSGPGVAVPEPPLEPTAWLEVDRPHELHIKIQRDSESALQAFTHLWRAEMTTKTSRRAVLAGAAALPALSLSTLAAEPDPIVSVIERHRALEAEGDNSTTK